MANRRWPFEYKLLALLLLAALPGSLGLVALMLMSDISIFLTALVALSLLLLIGWCSLTVTHKSEFLFRTLSNLLEAMSTGDYSLRGRRELSDSALGDLVVQINRLSQTLSEQQLSVKSHQLLVAKIINQIDVAIIAFDEQEQITLANPAAARLLGTTTEQLRGASASALALDTLMAKGNQKLVEWSFAQRSGRFSLHLDHFIEGGRNRRLLFITDVRDILREEERKSWQNLVRVLSHEINNSLTPISSLSQTLSRLVDQSTDIEQDKQDISDSLGIIHERANSLKTFIDSYRQISRLPSPKPMPTPLLPLLEQLPELFAERDIVVDCDSRLSAMIDPVQFEQLLINLVKNADEAMTDNQGSVCVTARANLGELILTIADQGRGLTNAQNLFVPFYTTKPGGSGIGLVLCRQIVEGHGGDLRLDNRPDGPGCVVTLHVPLDPELSVP